MTTIYLVRHGQATGNAAHAYQGEADNPLSEQGRMQLVDLARHFKDIPLDAVYTSPLQRARETAEAIRDGGDIPLYADDRLIELRGGEWENVPVKVIAERYPDAWYAWMNESWNFRAPGGESSAEVLARAGELMGEIALTQRGKTVAVVGHGMCIRMAICAALSLNGADTDQIGWLTNGAYSKIEIDDGERPRLAEHNAYHFQRPESQNNWAPNAVTKK